MIRVIIGSHNNMMGLLSSSTFPDIDFFLTVWKTFFTFPMKRMGFCPWLETAHSWKVTCSCSNQKFYPSMRVKTPSDDLKPQAQITASLPGFPAETLDILEQG